MMMKEGGRVTTNAELLKVIIRIPIYRNLLHI